MHFWSSNQAKAHATTLQKYALINGELVPYDICSDTLNHHCMWSDMVYLGQGIFHSCDPKPRKVFKP